MKISELQAILAAARHKYGDIEAAVLNEEWAQNSAIGCVEVCRPFDGAEEKLGAQFLSISEQRLSNGASSCVEVLFAEGAK